MEIACVQNLIILTSLLEDKGSPRQLQVQVKLGMSASLNDCDIGKHDPFGFCVSLHFTIMKKKTLHKYIFQCTLQFTLEHRLSIPTTKLGPFSHALTFSNIDNYQLF